jgi:hypothetical protein
VCAPRCIFRSDLAVAASFSFPGLVCVARAPSEPLVLTLPGISRSGSARSQFSHQAPPGFYSRLFYVRARDPISCSLFLVRATRLFFGLLLPFCLSAHFSCLLVRSVLQSGRRVFVVNVSSVLSCFGLPFCVASSSLFSSQQQSESFSVQGAHLFNRRLSNCGGFPILFLSHQRQSLNLFGFSLHSQAGFLITYVRYSMKCV